jgi:hypothetical protein
VLEQIAQEAPSLPVSPGVLGFLLGGGLIVALTSAYKFAVSLRTTERGLARQRERQANQNARSAMHEAALWQSRSGDLEYVLRNNGLRHLIPPLDDELRKLVAMLDSDPDASQWNDPQQSTERPKS